MFFTKGKTAAKIGAIFLLSLSLAQPYNLPSGYILKASGLVINETAGFSVDSSIFLIIAPIIIAVLMIWRFGLSGLLITTGLAMIAAAIVGFIYESGIALIIGAILFLLGLWLWSRRRISVGGIAGRIGSNYSWRQERSQWAGRSYVLILGVLTLILGLGISQIILIGVGAVLSLIGLYLWRRKRPGLYRPMTPGYNPTQERRQFRSGTPVLFLGVIAIILGLLLSWMWLIIAGAVVAAIGLLLRIF